MNKDIFVEQIIPTTGPTFGHCDNIELARKNLELIYRRDILDELYIETVDNGIFRFFDKYCQYIFSIQTSIIPRFHVRMVVIDCHSNVDAALDIFMDKESSLLESEKTRFMDLFNEIENDNLKEKANLVVFNNNPI
jgi:hypothetical protein